MNLINLPFKKIFNKKNLIHKNYYKKLVFLNKKIILIMIKIKQIKNNFKNNKLKVQKFNLKDRISIINNKNKIIIK